MRSTVAIVVLCCSGGTSLALEMHPPWIHHQQKPKSPAAPPWVSHEKIKDNSPYHPPWVEDNKTSCKSPYNPPWIGTRCHHPEFGQGGVWTYPVDWRDVDWSDARQAAGLHQRTQAFSLKIDACLRGDRPVKPPKDAILEYYRDPRTAKTAFGP
ncbi:MAG: hypothetical protein B7Z55_12060 [Planctomycetales bacterium 12-60-4]|nr:MAG: hypothetical protein B7Z55_12060 [Planctomycetales bacterium 12-60-4]